MYLVKVNSFCDVHKWMVAITLNLVKKNLTKVRKSSDWTTDVKTVSQSSSFNTHLWICQSVKFCSEKPVGGFQMKTAKSEG